MPVRWDENKRYRILLMILAQHPTILSRIDSTKISTDWTDGEKPTPRAVQEQVKFFRAEIKKLRADAGATPATPSSRSVFRTPSKPRTSAVGTPSKLSRGGPGGTPSSSAKKRKLNTGTAVTGNGSSNGGSSRKQRKNPASDSDSDFPALTDEPEASDSSDIDDNDAPLSNVPLVKEKRSLPARNKSRSKSYNESDGDGEDAGAQQDDNDSDYDLLREWAEREREGRIRGASALDRVMRNMGVGLAGTLVGERGGGGVGRFGDEVEDEAKDRVEDGRIKREADSDDGESMMTKTTTTVWQDAAEHMDEDENEEEI